MIDNLGPSAEEEHVASASRPIAVGHHRQSFNGLIDKAGPLLGTPDESLARDALEQYIDTQRGRSGMRQVENFVFRTTILAIDFDDIRPYQPTADSEEVVNAEKK